MRFRVISSILYLCVISALFFHIVVVGDPSKATVSVAGAVTSCHLPIQEDITAISQENLSAVTELVKKKIAPNDDQRYSACDIQGLRDTYVIYLKKDADWEAHIDSMVKFFPTYACRVVFIGVKSKAYTILAAKEQVDVVKECSSDVSGVHSLEANSFQ